MARPSFACALLCVPLVQDLPTSGGPVRQPRDLTAQFEVPKNVKVQEWALSPLFFNPAAIDVDEHGRVWVAEAVNYRQWNGRNPGRHHAEGDRIVVVSDEDGDGIAETSQVYAQDEELVAPLGIAVVGDVVYVSCSPKLYAFRDKDGDLRADEKVVVYDGFGGRDHDHGLHSAVEGPDGALWFAAGNAGPHIVRAKDGWTLRSGSLYRDGGPAWVDNQPGLASDDGRTWTGGLVLRGDGLGRSLRVLAHNFRNNYEVALDSHGDFYLSDNDDDGNQACRTLWCLPGGDHGYFSADGSRYWMADKRPGQSTVRAHWHQDDPGVAPTGTITGAGGPTGVCVHESRFLAPELFGAVLCADAGRNRVWAQKPRIDKSRIELDTGVLIASKGDDQAARWFRPSDVCTGPDGTVYVADWWDPGVGGHGAGDGEALGRILRLVPRDDWPWRAHHDWSLVEDRIKGLMSPCVSVQAKARAMLRTNLEGAAKSLLEKFEHGEPHQQARALWLLADSKTYGDEVLRKALTSSNARLVTVAARIFAAREGGLAPIAASLARHSSPLVRREVATLLREVPFEAKRAALVELMQRLDPDDRTMVEALGLACEGDEERALRLSSELWRATGPLAWPRAHARLAWRLHPASAVSDFVARAMAQDLDEATRLEAIDAIAFVQERPAAEAMATLALALDGNLQERARWWTKQRATNDWAVHELEPGGSGPGLEDARSVWRGERLRAGSVAVDCPVEGMDVLWLLVDAAGSDACDWADWLEPEVTTRSGAVVDLSLEPMLVAEAGFGAVSRGANCSGGALSVAGAKHARGIGTHAPSRLAFALPKDALRLRARAAVDDGGANQGCGDGMVFEVRATPARLDVDWSARLEPLAREGTSKEALEEALEALCAEPRGALLVVAAAQKGELSAEARAAATTRLASHPDLGLRALAAAALGASAARREPAAVLALQGDDKRGEALFFSAKAGCSTCHVHHGRGGEIGPDLTALRGKQARAEILRSILEPGAAIAFGYDSWLFETVDEEVVGGFLLSDGDVVVVKDTQGARRALKKEEIVARRRQTASLMPDGVALGLSDQELADLLAFLEVDPKSPGRPGATIELFNGKDLSGWVPWLADASVDPSTVWSVADGVLRCEGSPAGYIRTEARHEDFILELEWRFDPARTGNSGVLMRTTGPDRIWPRSIEAQLMHRNAGDIWNIGDVPMRVDPARVEGARARKALPCNEVEPGGWNRYRIVLDGGEMTLEVNGELQNSASWCERIAGHICLQSEGATIEFRNIRLTPLSR